MKPPKMLKHATGNWFVKWGGKNRYLGKDKVNAEELYLDQIDEWKQWQVEKRKLKQRTHIPQINRLADQFCEAKKIENGTNAEKYYQKHLKRFLMLFGNSDTDMVRPHHLNALKLYMIEQGFKPKTINHDLGAVRIMYNWASGLELIESINFKGVKNLPLGPTEDVSLSLEKVKELISSADDILKPWLAINYLCLIRPSEVVRVVQGEGQWVEEGIFRLDRGKMDRKASIKRHCVFSPLALEYLDQCKPHWSRLDSYSSAACRHGVYPKLLQKSAATHLVQSGAHPADIELLLGHVKGRLAVLYYHPHWQRLREVASRLEL